MVSFSPSTERASEIVMRMWPVGVSSNLLQSTSADTSTRLPRTIAPTTFLCHQVAGTQVELLFRGSQVQLLLF